MKKDYIYIYVKYYNSKMCPYNIISIDDDDDNDDVNICLEDNRENLCTKCYHFRGQTEPKSDTQNSILSHFYIFLILFKGIHGQIPSTCIRWEGRLFVLCRPNRDLLYKQLPSSVTNKFSFSSSSSSPSSSNSYPFQIELKPWLLFNHPNIDREKTQKSTC